MSLFGPIGTVARSLVPVGTALVKNFSGTSVSHSGSSQYSLDDAIKKLSSITDENTRKSVDFANAQNAFQEAQNDKAMEFSAREAAKNRDWQKMMSDTAHQREVKDLLAAGLNPVLSASGGNGAAVGSGATASGVTSSGSKGEVDTSLSGAMVSMLSSMLSAQTQLAQTAMSARSNEAIADKNNAMSELIARITGQYGLERQQVASAATRYAADKQSDNVAAQLAHDTYIHQNYPNNMYQAISALVKALTGDSLSDFVEDVSGSVSGFGSDSELAVINTLADKGLLKMSDSSKADLKKLIGEEAFNKLMQKK